MAEESGRSVKSVCDCAHRETSNWNIYLREITGCLFVFALLFRQEPCESDNVCVDFLVLILDIVPVGGHDEWT